MKSYSIQKRYTDATEPLVIAEAETIIESIVRTYSQYITDFPEIPEHLKNIKVSPIEDNGSNKQITFTGPTIFTNFIEPVLNTINTRPGAPTDRWEITRSVNTNTAAEPSVAEMWAGRSRTLIPAAQDYALENLSTRLGSVSFGAIAAAGGRGIVGRRMAAAEAGQPNTAMNRLAAQRAAMRATVAQRAAGGSGGYRRTKRHHMKRRHTKRRHTKRR
jgi:hypothetical protein